VNDFAAGKWSAESSSGQREENIHFNTTQHHHSGHHRVNHLITLQAAAKQFLGDFLRKKLLPHPTQYVRFVVRAVFSPLGLSAPSSSQLRHRMKVFQFSFEKSTPHHTYKIHNHKETQPI
jgi:hypothetical protein